MTKVFDEIGSNTRKKILDQFLKTEKDADQDTEIIINWSKSQHHLPETPTKKMIEFFLVNNKFSIEITKQKLDMYYTIRSLMPDFYKTINPKLQRMKASFETSYCFPLPKLINDLDRVFFVKFKDISFDEVNPDGLIGKLINVQEIRIQEDLMASQYVIIDCEYLHLHEALKFTPMHAKIGAAVLEKVYSNSIKEIHVINFHPVANILLKLSKLVLKPKIYNRIKMHESVDTLRKHIPVDVLPKDYGGNDKSLDEIQELWREKFKEYQNRFDELENLKVNEGLRERPLEDVEVFGVQGTFKKLNID